MKKILFLSVMALVAGACSTTPNAKKEAGVCITNVIANPAEYVGKEISVAAKVAGVCDSLHQVMVVGEDSTKVMVAQLADTVKLCPSLAGKQVTVVGSLVKNADESYHIAATSVCKAECCKKAAGDSTKCAAPAVDSAATK